jgi:hypothetical protein
VAPRFRPSVDCVQGRAVGRDAEEWTDGAIDWSRLTGRDLADISAVLAADAKVVEPLVGSGESIYLPAGPGVFVSNVIGCRTIGGGKTCIYATARTWLLTTRAKRVGSDHRRRGDGAG